MHAVAGAYAEMNLPFFCITGILMMEIRYASTDFSIPGKAA